MTAVFSLGCWLVAGYAATAPGPAGMTDHNNEREN